MNKIVQEIDMSNVKIWSRKKGFFIPFARPHLLILFPENSGKCKCCGFYKSACMCKERKQKRNLLNPIKEIFKQWLKKKMIEYHKRKYNRLMKKSRKIEKKVSKHYNFLNRMQKSQTNRDQVEIDDSNLKDFFEQDLKNLEFILNESEDSKLDLTPEAIFKKNSGAIP